MRTRVFTSIAICALALGLTGCRVQSVLVVPPPTPYAYAAPGMVRTAAAAAGRVCLISENSLAFLNVKGIGPAENDPARHRA